MPRKLVVEPRARAEIQSAISWWRENRDKAPKALAENLKDTIRHLREFPAAGQRLRGRRRDHYRVNLRRVRFALYYRHDGDIVRLLSLWQGSRLPPGL